MKKTGILLPIFSLPNKYGIGTLGKSAYVFIDFLKKSKQDYWQILPTNPTSYGDSPYQSFSIFAQNQYFIDLEMLVEDGLLTKDEIDNSYLSSDSSYIDYGNIFVNKNKILKHAYSRHSIFKDEFTRYKRNNRFWLNDYALFMVLKAYHNNVSFDNWEDKYRYRDPEALKRFYKDNRKDIDSIKFMQFLYRRQWDKLHEYANKKGIEIVGDMPIYVAYDSCDVWKDPRLFMLDKYLKPTEVAGVPPDYFSDTGQLWGNPLYNYEVMENEGYNWWIKRIKYALSLTDLVRIDHFRGFSAFYAIPYGAKDAINGRWIDGPKEKLFDLINRKLHNPKIIAENLGLLDDDVYNLIEHTGYPGMKILEFEVFSKENIEKITKESSNNIMYPGTHDNNTFMGWLFEDASDDERNVVMELLGDEPLPINERLVKYSFSFPYDTIIIMYQDVLGMSSNARINMPGKPDGNWRYMFSENDFSDKIANMLAKYKNKRKTG